jgi:hypothetical protein
MPEKPLAERIKRAKREGVAVAIKKDDLEPAMGRSPHSLKKSRGIVSAQRATAKEKKPWGGLGTRAGNNCPPRISGAGSKEAPERNAYSPSGRVNYCVSIGETTKVSCCAGSHSARKPWKA